MKFGQLLAALRAKGKAGKADHYEKLVSKRFEETLTKQQIEQLDVEEIVTIIKVADVVKASQLQPQKPSALESYVLELQSKGFTVSLGERFK